MHIKPKKKSLRILGIIIQDVLLTGALLCVFACFQHVLPYYTAAQTEKEPIAYIPKPTEGTKAVTESAEPSSSVTEATSIDAQEPVPPEGEELPAEEEKNLTEWQRKFAEHFTDEVVITDHSYSSPEVSIDISTYHEVLNGYNQVWYVSDIYIAQIENFQTYAGKHFASFYNLPMEELSQEAQALVSINGDYCNSQVQWGFYIRNGEVFDTDQTICDICVLYYDGTMETYAANEYKVEDILERSPYQVWKFGPALLDGEGKAYEKFSISEAIAIGNPRSAIGYYEPGHYCFVTCDGRQEPDWSRGLTINQLAELFESLGCKAAYNLDGGASATLTFNGSLYNRQSSERDIGDILLIREIEHGEDE